MGPDRDKELEAPDERERMRQEMEQLLLTTKRLLTEMQALMERAHALAARNAELVKDIKHRGDR